MMEYSVEEITGMEMFKQKLSCGMSAVFIPLPKIVQSSMFHLYTRFGSIDAKFRDLNTGKVQSIEDGTAHFLEHCAFYNSDGVDALNWFDFRGDRSNAWTSFDHTTYYFATSGRVKYDGLKYLIDFVTRPYFTDEIVEKERGNITQEIAQSINNPVSNIFNALKENLFVNHPFRRKIIGDPETISRITKEQLLSSYETFYGPSNLNLVMFVPTSASRSAARRYFDLAERICQEKGLKYVKPPEYLYAEEPPEVDKKIMKFSQFIPKLMVGLAFKGDLDMSLSREVKMRNYLLSDILMDVLFSNSSKDFYELNRSGYVLDDFSAGYYGGRSFGIFYLLGSTPDSEIFMEKMVNFIRDGVNGKMSRDIFEANKGAMIKNMAEISEYQDIDELASFVVHELAADRDPMEYLKILLSIDYDDVIEHGQKFLDTENFVEVVALPAEL